MLVGASANCRKSQLTPTCRCAEDDGNRNDCQEQQGSLKTNEDLSGNCLLNSWYVHINRRETIVYVLSTIRDTSTWCQILHRRVLGGTQVDCPKSWVCCCGRMWAGFQQELLRTRRAEARFSKTSNKIEEAIWLFLKCAFCRLN